MKIEIPEIALVLVSGGPNADLQDFAQRHFAPQEIISIGSLEADLKAIASRLEQGLLSVVLGAEQTKQEREALIALARRLHILPSAIVIKGSEAQDSQRLKGLKGQGIRDIHLVNSETLKEIRRRPLRSNLKADEGPFDIIGDVHGCVDELRLLLARLGYDNNDSLENGPLVGEAIWLHPAGRKAIFLGDLNDRGPASVAVLKLVFAMVKSGSAIAIAGNHEEKLVKKFSGKQVNLRHGLAETWQEIEALPGGSDGPQARELRDCIRGLFWHYELDGGKLVVAHAGMREEMIGGDSGKARSFALWGETTGEIDEFGLPVRVNWAAEYRGKAAVVYGHTPVPEAKWFNNTLCLDTGCCFGGKLTALRWPELEMVDLPAAETYCQPSRPLDSSTLAQSLAAHPSD